MLIDSQLRAAVQPELKPDEELLWAGRPNVQRLVFTCSDIFSFLFLLVWEGWILASFFASLLFWQQHGGFSLADVGGLAILAIMLLTGLLFLSSTVIWSFRGLTTIYALTNKRAIIITTLPGRSVQSYGSADIGAIECTELPDGSGDLAFAKRLYKDSEGQCQETDVTFVGIANVRSVEDLFRSVFNKGW